MSRILADLKAFALQYLRNPFGAAFSIGFPLLLIVVFGAMFTPSELNPDCYNYNTSIGKKTSLMDDP